MGLSVDNRWIALSAGVLVVAAVLVSVASAWAPSRGSPSDEGPRATSSFAATARETGYDVRTSVLGSESIHGEPADGTLYVVVGTAGGQGPPGLDQLVERVESGGRVLVADHGQAAEHLQRWGWQLKDTAIYNAQLDIEDARRVPLTWRVPGESGQTYRVEGSAPLRLSPAPASASGSASGSGSGSAGDGPRGTPIRTGNGTFADLDGNGELDETDLRGPFTVGVQVASEEGGRLVYVTTPWPLMDGAGDDVGVAGDDPDQFHQALLAWLLPEGGTVVVDESRAERPTAASIGHAPARWGAAALSCEACRVLVPAGLTAAGLVAVLRLGRQRADWGSHEPELDEVTYPDDVEDLEAVDAGPDPEVDPDHQVDPEAVGSTNGSGGDGEAAVGDRDVSSESQESPS